jgi:predicted component of type VI protein secretion system
LQYAQQTEPGANDLNVESTPQCHFVFFTGPRAGQAEAFHSARVTVGRSADADFRVEAAPDDVASQHAEIILEEQGRWVINDLATRGGTFINGQKVKERQILLPEDYIRFGRTGPEVIFRAGQPVPGYQPIPQLIAEDAQLQFFSGSDRGKTFAVSGSAVTRVGRRAEYEISLDPRGDMIVSGNHCSIVFEDGAFLLTDTSRNGTYLNGELVEGSVPLNDGDVIMLGDGGPEARFRSKSSGVIYPNLRAYYHHSSQQQGPEQPATVPASQQDLFTGSPGASPTPIHPPPQRLPYSGEGRRRVWPWLLLLLLAGGAIGYWYTRRGTSKPTRTPSTAQATDYLPAVKSATTKHNQVGLYAINLPEGWALRQQDALYSIESPDKEIAVDYARSLALTEANVYKLLTQDGAKAGKLPMSGRSGNSELGAYVAKGSGVARMAVLHRPKGEVPTLALLETQDSVLARLPEELLRSLLVDGIKTDRLPVPGTPTPVPTATPAATARPTVAASPVPSRPTPTPVVSPVTRTPTPAQTTQNSSTPANTALTPSNVARVTTPAPSGTPVTTPATPQATSVATPAAADATATPTGAAPAGGTIASQKLALAVELPENWTGSADEEEGILNLADNDNLQVRVARNRKTANLESILKSLEREGWKRGGVRAKTSFSMAELRKGAEDLILVVIPEPAAGTSLLIYASRDGNITELQRNGIVHVVQQLRPSTAGAARTE